MLSIPERPPLYPCYDLYELNRQFGGERENLPQHCFPFVDEPLETLATTQP